MRWFPKVKRGEQFSGERHWNAMVDELRRMQITAIGPGLRLIDSSGGKTLMLDIRPVRLYLVKVGIKTYAGAVLTLKTKKIDTNGNELDTAEVDTYIMGDLPTAEADRDIGLSCEMKVGDVYWAFDEPISHKRTLPMLAPEVYEVTVYGAGGTVKSCDVKYYDLESAAPVGTEFNVSYICYPAADAGPFIQMPPADNLVCCR